LTVRRRDKCWRFFDVVSIAARDVHMCWISQSVDDNVNF
jgi:hypothetical protein